MGSQGYVLNKSSLSTANGGEAVLRLLEQADEHERHSAPLNGELGSIVERWTAPSGPDGNHAGESRAGDEDLQPAGKHLLALVAASHQHRRARADQVRGVSDPRTLPHLLQDLHLGRAIVIVPSPLNPNEIAAWAILDLDPRRAPESHARVVYELMDNFPHYHTTPSGTPQLAGHQRLRFAGMGQGPEARPKVAFVAQILRLREIPGWEAPGGMPLGDWLREALWQAMEPYLREHGAHLLVGEKLVSLDGVPVVPTGASQPGEVKDGWSFYDQHFRPIGTWAHETFSSTGGMIGALQAAFPPAGGETRTDLAYSVMIVPIGNVTLDMEVGRAASISLNTGSPSPAAANPGTTPIGVTPAGVVATA